VPELDFTAHPRSASQPRGSATRVAAHPSGARSCAPLRPLRLLGPKRGRAPGRALPGARAGPKPNPHPPPRAEPALGPRASGSRPPRPRRAKGSAAGAHRPQAAFGAKGPYGGPLGGARPRACAPPPQLPLSGGAAFYGGVVGEAVRAEKKDGKKSWVSRAGAGLSPLWRSSAGGRRASALAALHGASLCAAWCALSPLIPPSPSSPHPAPSRWPGFTVIQLGAFTALTLGLEHKSLARRRSREASSTPSLEGGAGWGLAEA
jgi:hypothetical protein